MQFPYTVCLNYNRKIINPFSHRCFWRFCGRQLFEIMSTKEEIAQKQQFLLLSPYFHSIQLVSLSLYFHLKGVSNFFFGFVFKVVICRFCCIGKGLKTCRHCIQYSISPSFSKDASKFVCRWKMKFLK